MSGGFGVWHLPMDELFIRMLASVLLGGLIGMEREWSNHAAGFRTHILVCLGSCTIMLLSIYGFPAFMEEPNVRVDPARLAAQVVSGIGFLGAGAILRNGSVVSGLTTAASIWVVAAIGLCVGAGFMVPALTATLLAFISLLVLNKLEFRVLGARKHGELTVHAYEDAGALARISSQLDEHGVEVVNVKVERRPTPAKENETRRTMLLRIKVKLTNQSRWLAAVDAINKADFVIHSETSKGA